MPLTGLPCGRWQCGSGDSVVMMFDAKEDSPSIQAFEPFLRPRLRRGAPIGPEVGGATTVTDLDECLG